MADRKKILSKLIQIMKEELYFQEEDITAHGRKGDLVYIVFGENNPRLYLLDVSTLKLEIPAGGGNTFWDSRNHGITWKTRRQVLDSIAAAYELMDHKEGQKEEWYAEPYDFEENGALLEKLSQPGYNHQSNACLKNSTLLVGRLDHYGLKLNVGGRGWRGGYSPMGLEEAVALMTLYGKKAEDK